MELLDKEEISKKYNIKVESINRLIYKKKFPPPDKRTKGRGQKSYWYNHTLEPFFEQYNKAKGKNKVHFIDYETRRNDYLKKARMFVIKNNILTAFDYRAEYQKAKNKHDIPDPTTLFCYDISFNDIVNTSLEIPKENMIITDKTTLNIIKLIERRWISSSEIAKLLNISERTVYRKIKVLKEQGLNIEAGVKGYRLWSIKENESNERN